MKTFFNVMLAAMFILASCCNDEEITPRTPSQERVPVTFYGVELNPVRASFSNFFTGDSIGVYMFESGTTLSDETIIEDASNIFYEAVTSVY